MSPTFHPPTAVAVAGGMLIVGLAVWLIARGRRKGFLGAVDRVTYSTLHTASMASRHLADGLTPEAAERAGRHLLTILGANAVAICSSAELLAWTGTGSEPHAGHAFAHARATLSTGNPEVYGPETVACADPDCPVRSAVVAPLVADERVVGTLAAYAPAASAGLARATGELARWVSAELDVSELGHARTRAMEAELRALRAQISPHFIYNSLAAIASFVRTDPERARELLLEFADFTRYALRRDGAFTTLAEELRNVERYLVLEQARFGERLEVSLLIAPEVLPVRVPYLAVQPLVENAVRHGLSTKEGTGHITISASDHGSDAEISIDDDGVGSDPTQMQRILDGAFSGDSVGLGNVNARLRQVYGDEYGLVVETAVDEGMRVSFRVPKYAPAAHDA